MLVNTITQSISIPLDKRDMIKSKKTTILKLQQLTGLLNFFGRCIVPARAYNHCFYSKYSHKPNLKQYHHFRVDREIRSNCEMWLKFLYDQSRNMSVKICDNNENYINPVVRPFDDFKLNIWTTDELDFYTDASKAKNL